MMVGGGVAMAFRDGVVEVVDAKLDVKMARFAERTLGLRGHLYPGFLAQCQCQIRSPRVTVS